MKCGWSALVLLSGALAGCGGTPTQATQNRVFYDWAVATDSSGAGEFEVAYPPLDLSVAPPAASYKGVTLLRGGIHLSKPKSWILRDAGNQPGQSYVGYISPNAYSFGIYERPESVSELWRDILKRFEDDTQALGAKIVGQRVPVATSIGQGRAYSIQREVEAAKGPMVSRSREYLVRGESRVVLVQIVFGGEELSQLDSELLRVIETLEVL